MHGTNRLRFTPSSLGERERAHGKAQKATKTELVAQTRCATLQRMILCDAFRTEDVSYLFLLCAFYTLVDLVLKKVAFCSVILRSVAQDERDIDICWHDLAAVYQLSALAAFGGLETFRDVACCDGDNLRCFYSEMEAVVYWRAVVELPTVEYRDTVRRTGSQSIQAQTLGSTSSSASYLPRQLSSLFLDRQITGTQAASMEFEPSQASWNLRQFPIHFAFFVWACRRVDVKRRLERRESCDRCLTMRLKEDMASRGSDIVPMPSRAYHKIQDDHIWISPTPTSPTRDFPSVRGTSTGTPPTPPTPPTPSTAISPSFISPVPTETVPNRSPRVGERYHELDVEQQHITYVSTSPRSPRYRFEDSDDDESAPPTPPPKLQYRGRDSAFHEDVADESSFHRFQKARLKQAVNINTQCRTIKETVWFRVAGRWEKRRSQGGASHSCILYK
ncbi:MAG: hypothetical protein Q9191_004819 [Dirinaria sp. TL-2023a]